MNRFKKYLALTRAGIIECINYRMSLAVMVFGNLLYLTLIYFVWKAIFASSGSDVCYPQLVGTIQLSGGRRHVKKYIWSF